MRLVPLPTPEDSTDVIDYQEARDPEQLRRHLEDLRAAVGFEREL